MREKVSREEVLSLIKSFAKEIYEGFKRGDPVIEYVARGSLKTIEYDPKKDIIKLKRTISRREFFNLGHVRKFSQMLLVTSLAKELLENNKTASLRETYYILKHTVPYIDVNTFEEQNESDMVIEDIERSLDLIREQFHIKADARGAIFGDITLRDKRTGDEFNCSKMGIGGWRIPSTVEEIEILDINADYVLVVEKVAQFERLIEEKFPQKNRAILITGQGQASRGTRRLIHRLRYEHNLPVYVFTDGDPWGYYIYSVIKRGSMKLSQFSELLATPDVKFVGMTMEDVFEYGLEKYTMKLRAVDEKRVRDLMEYPWFKNDKRWQKQFKIMLEKKIKVELDALAAKGLAYIAEKYLPDKLSNPSKLLN